MSLEYRISANVDGFRQGTKQVVDGLNQLDAVSKKSLTNLSRNTDQAGVSLNSLNQVLRDSGNFAISTQTGFLAISNNLPILIDQFQQVKRETGSTAAAFRAFGSAFFGPAGLVSLIGLAATALPILIGKFLQSKDAAEKAKNEILSFNDVLRNAEGSIIGQQAQVDGLVAVYGKLNASLTERKRALEELRRINQSYFGDLDAEKTSLQELKKRVDEYNQALVQEAIIKGARAELEKLGPAFAKAAKTLKDADRALFDATQGADFDANGVRLINLSQDVALLSIKQKEAQKEFQNVNAQIKDYISLINDASDALVNFRPLSGKPEKIPVVKATAPVEILPTRVTLDVSQFQGDVDINRQFRIDSGIEIPVNLTFPENVRRQFTSFADAQLRDLQAKLDLTKQFSEQLAAQLSQSFSNVFASVGEGLGNVLAGIGNGFNAAQLVLTGLADVLINVGKLAIQTGVAIRGIKKALQSLNPAVAIAGGVALVALGTAVKGRLANSVPKFAEGGIVTRPTAGIFGEAGPEAIIPLDRLNAMVSSTNGGNVNVTVGVRMRGNELYGIVQQEAQRQGRTF